MNVRALVIIEADRLEEARQMLLEEPFSHSAEEAGRTFRPAGSPTGAAPATHCWLSASMRPDVWAACQAACEALAWAQCWPYDLLTEPGFPGQKLAELGLQPLTREVVL